MSRSIEPIGDYDVNKIPSVKEILVFLEVQPESLLDMARQRFSIEIDWRDHPGPWKNDSAASRNTSAAIRDCAQFAIDKLDDPRALSDTMLSVSNCFVLSVLAQDKAETGQFLRENGLSTDRIKDAIDVLYLRNS